MLITTTTRLKIGVGLAAVVTALALSTAGRAVSPKFYDDDPLWHEPDTQDASDVQPREISLLYDSLEKLFTDRGDPTPNVRAQNLNTLDEVPDSSWFTNRAGTTPLGVDDVTRGPNVTTGPAEGPWTVIAAKSDGVTPGFTVRDTAGVVWFIKFDPPGYRGMGTGTEVAMTKLFWAVGYHVPETHVAHLRRDRLAIGEGVSMRLPGGKRRPLRDSDLSDLMRRAERDPDGTYRVVASRGLPGRPLGGFDFYGTRPDDPNDYVPHEHRRELRGYRAFAAWTNHVDSKSINTLDTLVSENGRTFVRHHLLDFSSTLGSGSVHPREPFEGHEHLVELKDAAKGIPTFGFHLKEWRTMPMYRARSIGAIPSDNTGFDPDAWRARIPNPAFLRARPDDLFWAATKMAALTDPLIAAMIRTGEFDDPPSEEMLVQFLVERRDATVRKYFTQVNPVVRPALDGTTLTFGNAAVDAGVAPAPEGYKVGWYRFDNATRDTTALGDTTTGGTTAPAPRDLPEAAGSYVKVEIAATNGPHPSWAAPVHAYFRRAAGAWHLVGFERMPEGNPPMSVTRNGKPRGRQTN
jgi:hypothetical protein